MAILRRKVVVYDKALIVQTSKVFGYQAVNCMPATACYNVTIADVVITF